MTDVFLDALAEAALLQLQHFSAKQLATLAYNYGTLNHWGRNDQELLDAITIRMLHQHHVTPPPSKTSYRFWQRKCSCRHYSQEDHGQLAGIC